MAGALGCDVETSVELWNPSHDISLNAGAKTVVTRLLSRWLPDTVALGMVTTHESPSL